MTEIVILPKVTEVVARILRPRPKRLYRAVIVGPSITTKHFQTKASALHFAASRAINGMTAVVLESEPVAWKPEPIARFGGPDVP